MDSIGHLAEQPSATEPHPVRNGATRLQVFSQWRYAPRIIGCHLKHGPDTKGCAREKWAPVSLATTAFAGDPCLDNSVERDSNFLDIGST
jgi:hypothetical protein